MDAMLVISVIFMLQGLPVTLSSTSILPWPDKTSCEAWEKSPEQVGILISHAQILAANTKCFTKAEFEELQNAAKDGDMPPDHPKPKTDKNT